MTAEKEMEVKVLLIDDDHHSMTAIVDCLGDQFAILYATNGVFGCKIAIKELPELIILDWDMPNMNGIEVLSQLKSQPETQHIPVIIATGAMTAVAYKKKALAAGVIDFIPKPFEPLTLSIRVRAALQLSQTHRRAQLLKQQKTSLRKALLSQQIGEIGFRADQIHKKHQLLNCLSKQIERLACALNDGETGQLNHLKANLAALLNIEEDQKALTRFFEKTYPGIIKSLYATCPEMTFDELQLCICIKIGLSTEDIANSISIDTHSLEKRLTLLHKKFKLNEGQSVSQYITTLSVNSGAETRVKTSKHA